MSSSHDLERLAREMRGASPVRSSTLLFLVMTFLVVAVIWAANAELDDITRADGTIVPSQQLQIVQASEAGILKAIFVEEGDVVEAGQVIVELDRTLLDGQLGQEQQRAFALMAQIARLEASVSGEDLVFEERLRLGTPKVILSETALFHARKQERDAQIKVLESRRVQREQEYQEGLVDVATAGETLQLIMEETAIMAPLVAERMEPETTMLALRRSQAEWRGQETRANAALVRLEAALSEIDDQLESTQTEFQSAALAELAGATAELAELETLLPALQQRVTRSELRAPVRGVVNKLNLTTIGGVAQTGQELVEIIPLDDSLLVEAFLKPADVAFIYAGQPVNVKITAYDFSRYGGLEGEVVRIGAGAVTRPDRDEEAFVIQVRTTSNLLDADGTPVEIIPGMVAQIDILSGKKTVLEYLTQPIVRVKERAFRE